MMMMTVRWAVEKIEKVFGGRSVGSRLQPRGFAVVIEIYCERLCLL